VHPDITNARPGADPVPRRSGLAPRRSTASRSPSAARLTAKPASST